jgi:hypothetical protein
LLTFWRKKLELAAYYLRASGMAIWKEKKILIPQFWQTILIWIMSVLYTCTTLATYFNLNKVSDTEITVSQRTISVTENTIFYLYTVLFVFLIFVIFYVTLGIKQLMIHSWYRGSELSFRKSFKIIQRRWWALMGYAFTCTIVHLIQFTYKFFKGEIKITKPLDAIKLTDSVKPEDVQNFQKKKTPLHERIWMGLNYFTMPAIVLENKMYITALGRSLELMGRNIVDIYIKGAYVNPIFKFMQYAMVVSSALLGAVLGGLFGYFLDLNVYLSIALAIPVFLIIGGGTNTLVLNDMSTSYTTIMYMHTVDELHGVHGYTRYELPEPYTPKTKDKKGIQKKGKIETSQQPLKPETKNTEKNEAPKDTNSPEKVEIKEDIKNK